jgi:hypothetical protein
MLRGFVVMLLGLLAGGCAAVAPFGSVLGSARPNSVPLQVYEETTVRLGQANFFLVKTNVWGRSKGFSLFGLLTIYPATLNKAMSRMYASAQMQPGQPQTLAHLVIEQSSSFYILFGIPKVDVRADIIQFVPKGPPAGKARAKPPDRKP